MSITNATLAQKINDLVQQWEDFQVEQQAWMNGVVGGGPNLDGQYPLTDYLGVTVLATCPAQLEADVQSTIDGGQGYADAAAASAVLAAISETNAGTSETNASASEAAALSYRDAALQAQADAESARTVAIAQAAAAVVSAANALVSENAASASEAAAAAWANTAEDVLVANPPGDGATEYSALHWAKKAEAFSINEALYAALADDETITGLWDFNSVQFNPIAAPAHVEGKLFYDTATKSLAYYNDEADVTLNIGQENYLRARNTTGVTILEGSVVYVNGATGNRVNIALAQADDAPQLTAVGVATHDIENNTDGYVTVLGVVHNLDTSSYTAGDEIFLSESTPGGFTSTVPTYPNRIVPIGRILTVNPTVGTVYVNIGSWHGYTLPEANEIITGSWTFSGTTPQFQMAETDATVDEGNWIFKAAGDSLKIATASDASPGTAVDNFLAILRTGTDATRLSLTTDLYLRAGANFQMYTDDDLSAVSLNPGATGASVTSFSTPNALRVSTGGTFADFRAGTTLRVNDAANTNKIALSHDGTHGTIDGNAVGNLKFTDWLAIELGTYNFDADQVVGVGQDNFVLTYDNATGQISLEVAAAGADPEFFRHVTTNYDSADVTVSASAPGSPAQGDIWFDTDAFVDISVDEINDVTITAIASGELLKWNGSAWINNTLVEAGISATGHAHTASDVTDFDTEVGNHTDVVANTAKVTNATHTGDVTGDTALTIAAKAVDVAMLADGVDGELITWSALGVAETVAVGTAGQILTSNGVGVAPTFQTGGGGGISNVVEDTTPELGGDLHMNGFDITDAVTINEALGGVMLALVDSGGAGNAANPMLALYDSGLVIKARFGLDSIFDNDVVCQAYDGELILASNELVRITADADFTNDVTISQSLFMSQQSAAATDVASDGQFWIDNSAEMFPVFTPDTGEDRPLAMALWNNVSEDVSDTCDYQYMNGIFVKNGSTARTLTLEASGVTTFPVGATCTLMNVNATTGDITITEGATTTLYILDGSTRTDTAGGCTLGPGGYATLYRWSAAVYFIMGAGLTA